MKRDEAVSVLGATLLVMLLLLGVREGYWSLTTVLEYAPYFIILGIFGLLGWGFRAKLKALSLTLSHEQPEEPKQDRRNFGELMDDVKRQHDLTLAEGATQSDDEHLTEFNVGWHLSGDIQPTPPFGSEDVVGSDRVSKLLVTQRGHVLTLTGSMKHLKPSQMYAVYLGKPAKPFSLGSPIYDKHTPNPVVTPEPPATFKTNELGDSEWTIRTNTDILARLGIVDNLLQVWINHARTDKSVLVSDSFTVIP